MSVPYWSPSKANNRSTEVDASVPTLSGTTVIRHEWLWRGGPKGGLNSDLVKAAPRYSLAICARFPLADFIYASDCEGVRILACCPLRTPRERSPAPDCQSGVEDSNPIPKTLVPHTDMSPELFFVVADAEDPDPSDNTASEGTTVLPNADLSVMQTDSPDPVMVGEQLVYTLGVLNASRSTATAAMLSHTVSGGTVSLSKDTAETTQVTCSRMGDSTTCDLGDMGPGQQVTLALVVVPESTGMLTSTAIVTANEFDPDMANNTSVEETTVKGGALCTLSVDPSYSGGVLTLDFELGATTSTSWRVWLVIQSNVLPVATISLPAIDPSGVRVVWAAAVRRHRCKDTDSNPACFI